LPHSAKVLRPFTNIDRGGGLYSQFN